MSDVLYNGISFLLGLFVLIQIGVSFGGAKEATSPLLSRPPRHTSNQIVLTPGRECYRKCDGTIRYCYFKFRTEFYTTMATPCTVCQTNSFERSKNQSSCQCIQADGIEKTILPINRQLPGPSIQVCQNDKLVIDVENAAEGTDTTVHWHGIFQKGSQYYDGVPHITQCPISAPNTFRYQFTVENAGTHFYHSHSSLYTLDGQYGPLIVRPPPRLNINSDLYDEDHYDHVIVNSDWMHELASEHFPGTLVKNPGQAPKNFLINGLGTYTNLKTGESTNTQTSYFNVTAGKRYRFRMINAFGTVCPSEFVIEGHQLKVIATDGEDIEPMVVDKIISVSGERYDFILDAKQNRQGRNSYWIQLRGLGECGDAKILQVAVLSYGNTVSWPETPRPTYDNPITGDVELNSLTATHCMDGKITNQICINQLKYAGKTSEEDEQTYADISLDMSFSFFTYNKSIFSKNKYDLFYIAIDGSLTATTVKNISYAEPNSPPISQYRGYEKLCNARNVSTCTKPCFCTHVINVPSNNVVDILLCDDDPFRGLYHPFHLHGYNFQVMAVSDFNGRIPTPDERNQFIRNYYENLKNNKLSQQPRKDTIMVPLGGCVILRFYTNNPGWWLFHCHFLWHTVSGMDVVIHVGDDSEMPPVPNGFPVCGDYKPPVHI